MENQASQITINSEFTGKGSKRNAGWRIMGVARKPATQLKIMNLPVLHQYKNPDEKARNEVEKH